MVDIDGISLDADTRDFLRSNEVRGVCLFRKNLGTEAQIRQLTADLREAMGPFALIGIDQEGGSVIRVTTLPQAPAAMALGAVNDVALTREVGAVVSRGLRSLGINWNFAPVLDVNNNPANPVIAERSFSADPDQVARLAGAWMQGAMAEGVACCAKHFPGHGDTHTDSHHASPIVDKSLEELEGLELRPFRALVDTAPALMTAHIVYPQIDPDHPATLSKPLVQGLLRESMRYQGVVITDALMMKAVHSRYGHARASVLALDAGVDMVLAQGGRHEQVAALQAIEAALNCGNLQESRLLQARSRLELLAQRFPAHASPYAAEQRAADEVCVRQAWARGLTGIAEPQVPSRQAHLRVITQCSVISDGVSEAGLPAERVRALFSGFTNVEFAQVSDLRTVGPEVFVQDGRCNVLVSNHRARYALRAPAIRPNLHLVLWNPFQVMDVVSPAVVTWGYGEGALQALQAWLEGALQITGIAPVPLVPAGTPTL
jgi:beta-N-acetylhexosaminidase